MKSEYITLLEKSKTLPNFYCSEEYMNKSGFIEKTQDDYIYWEIDKWIVTPPLHKITGEPITKISPSWMNKIWSDFYGWVMPGMVKSEFLDHEFIFDPESFLKMEGGEWQVFRKNCRKFPRRFQNGGLSYKYIDELYSKKGVEKVNEKLKEVLINWLSGKKDKEIFDDETMLGYLFYGKNRKVLFTTKGDIYGINIWDENYKYINFRFCICRQEAFLSEYIRYIFYTDPDILSKGKMVNDGGSVNNPQLEKFKMKMNPLRVRKVQTWTKIFG